jgi:hypothetical protein
MTTPKFAGGLGFRDIELFNLALLAQQAWRLLQNPETLNAQILKAVYYPNTDLLNASLGAHPLQVWRSILEGRDIMLPGLVRRIGIGEQTRACDENWLPRDEVRRPITCLENNAPQLVSDFIDQTSASWDLQKLQRFFLPMDVEVITMIPLSTRRIDGCWAWHFEKTGIFSVRTAYKMIINIKRTREAWIEEKATPSNHREDEQAWTSLWKVKVPSKIRVFLWRLAKQSIPTGDVRHRRNMAPDISCGICGQADSWRDSLLECNMARCVWALAPEAVTEHMERTTEPDTKQWLFSMIATLRQEDLTLCLVTLWAIWYARRKAIHEDISQSPLSTHHFVENFIRELKIVETKKPQAPSERPKPQVKKWLARRDMQK